MADVTLPNLRNDARSPLGAVTRPAFARTGSAGSVVRFVEEPQPLRRPTFFHRDTTETIKTIDTVLANTYPPGQLRPTPPATGEQPRGQIFGHRTGYKPLWLLAAGSAGNITYSLGAVALERGLWPVRPFPGAPPDQRIPEPLFGSTSASMALGTMAMVAGLCMAATASVLFFQDARRLSRRQNPATPSYIRPNVYFAAHMSAIVLSAGSKFMAEAMRDTLPIDYTWASATPGFVGQALFAVTQAQAFSSCELLNRKMRLRHRGLIGASGRFGVGVFTLWAAMMSLRNFNPYAREITRLFAQTCTAIAYSLPLTTARLGRQEGVNFESHDPDRSWRTLSVLGAYILGRCLAGYGPDLIQRGLFGNDANSSDSDTVAPVFGGASALTIGTAACIAALMLFREDVNRYNAFRGNVLVSVTTFALLCILAYGGVTQYAKQAHRDDLLWLGVVPGIVGAGLRLVTLPELFSYGELLRGPTPIPYRYHWTEACRATGNLCFSVWGVMNSVPTTNTFVKETLGVLAAGLVTLGMALPTTTSRKALPKYAWPLSPGATPIGTIEGTAFPFPEPV